MIPPGAFGCEKQRLPGLAMPQNRLLMDLYLPPVKHDTFHSNIGPKIAAQLDEQMPIHGGSVHLTLGRKCADGLMRMALSVQAEKEPHKSLTQMGNSLVTIRSNSFGRGQTHHCGLPFHHRQKKKKKNIVLQIAG